MTRKEWLEAFKILSMQYYQKGHEKRAERILGIISNASGNIKARSKKLGLECTITLEELRQLYLDNLYKPDKYFPDRTVTHLNCALDHIIPVHLKGTSTIGNLQLITQFSNNVKSNLTEDDLKVILNNLKYLREDLKIIVLKRLASSGGVFG